MEMRHLAGPVWYYPHDPDPARVQPSVALIEDGAGGATLVDAGNGPAHARRVRAAIAAAGLPPPSRLVYTHHHWDHVWGACAWPGVEVIGQHRGARLLEAEARRPWSGAYLRAEVRRNSRLGPSFTARAAAVPDWTGFAVVPPHTGFADRITLPGGVEARHVGGRHAEDSTVVAVPAVGVLLIGDAVYPPPLHLRGPDDGLDLALARRLLAEYAGYDRFVAAHGDPLYRSEVEALT